MTIVAIKFLECLIDSGLFSYERLRDSDFPFIFLGELFCSHSIEIVNVRCVSHRCYTRSGDFRVFSLTVYYRVDSDSSVHVIRPFCADTISGYCFRKLRKLLKVNGYI